VTEKDGGTTAAGPISEVTRATVRVRQLAVVMVDGRESSLRLTLDDRGVSLGREPAGHVVLPLADRGASRQHSRIEVDEQGDVWAVDCGSRNSTFVDGRRIESRTALRDGSVLRIGRTILIFVDVAIPSRVRLEPELGALRGNSVAMQRVRGDIALVARGDSPVLILGASGTGKELTAARLHAQSGRTGAFIAVNCAAIPSALAETTLFGHAAGAFTGATTRAEGVFAVADGGTLFLDEIAELEPAIQAKLLRVLATGELRPVGQTEARIVNVRVVAATHRDLSSMVEDGDFRGDLYARLSACVLRLPPLRERRDDIVHLALAFLAKQARGVELRVSAAEALTLFDWPYNVRQLENVLRASVLHADKELRPEHLPDEIASLLHDREKRPVPSKLPIELVVARDAVPDAEQLRSVVQHFGGNVTHVASYFGRDRKQIYRWAERLGVELPRSRGGSGTDE
jgi:DNA-binding NtrC family response regulator